MINKFLNQIEHYKTGRKINNDPVEQNFYNFGRNYLNDNHYINTQKLDQQELGKIPSRTDIINYIISHKSPQQLVYLEIGVRNPDDNFNKINAGQKFSVDPGVEFESNPVDFKMTSDEFFDKLQSGEILQKEIKFDVVFIDGLHLAEQVDRDIENSLRYLREDGFIVLHDCNPPTEWHAREDFNCKLTPAGVNWNGTVWKAFAKRRGSTDVSMCCVDTDWGVGIIAKNINFGPPLKNINQFFEYSWFESNKNEILNLISFDKFTSYFK